MWSRSAWRFQAVGNGEALERSSTRTAAIVGFLLYGFGKNERANIDRDELRFSRRWQRYWSVAEALVDGLAQPDTRVLGGPGLGHDPSKRSSATSGREADLGEAPEDVADRLASLSSTTSRRFLTS